MGPLSSINNATTAFSQQASVFDAIDAENPIIAWMRTIARNEVLRHMRPGSQLLELNAGTGLDAFHFAAHGIQVTATDGAAGMIVTMRSKCNDHPGASVQPILLPFNELQQLPARSYDHVFSNFGGLNCSSHLEAVLRQVHRVLRPGGTTTLVIMPRFSPWEAGTALHGNWSLASRRWKKAGTMAQVEGVPFPCYYYSVADVENGLGSEHERLSLRSLSFFVPPPHQVARYRRWPRAVRVLHWLEERTAHHWPFNHSGDHFLITMKKR